MTWIAPNNAILAAMTGSITGLGINPLPTFDYNIVSAIADPFVTPFYAVLNIFGGMLFTGLVLLPSIWFSNVCNLKIHTNNRRGSQVTFRLSPTDHSTAKDIGIMSHEFLVVMTD